MWGESGLLQSRAAQAAGSAGVAPPCGRELPELRVQKTEHDAKGRSYMTMDEYNKMRAQKLNDEVLYGKFSALRTRAGQTGEFDKLVRASTSPPQRASNSAPQRPRLCAAARPRRRHT